MRNRWMPAFAGMTHKPGYEIFEKLMRTVRFYCKSIEETSVLDPVESNHLARVLRLPTGAAVELFDGQGTLAEGVVEQIDRKQVTIRTTNIQRHSPRQHGRIILAVSFAKGQRFDWMVEKCTELGVDHIAAVQFDRTVKLGKASAVERLEKITLSAAKQSKRLFLPRLTGPARMKETAALLTDDYPGSTLLWGDPDGKSLSMSSQAENLKDTIVFIGPEGGFTQTELDFLQTIGAHSARINPNVLRVETAAVAFCALLSQ